MKNYEIIALTVNSRRIFASAGPKGNQLSRMLNLWVSNFRGCSAKGQPIFAYTLNKGEWQPPFPIHLHYMFSMRGTSFNVKTILALNDTGGCEFGVRTLSHAEIFKI
jgi:hypothetical protein